MTTKMTKTYYGYLAKTVNDNKNIEVVTTRNYQGIVYSKLRHVQITTKDNVVITEYSPFSEENRNAPTLYHHNIKRLTSKKLEEIHKRDLNDFINQGLI